MKRRVIAATVLGSSMAFIDATAVNVAIPLLQRDLHTTLSNVQWVIESYQLLLASLILAGGALGDHYGRRRVFAIGVVLFAMTSVGCGLAPNVLILIVARVAQGVAGALLVPSSLAIISASFDDNERGRVIGLWSSLTSLTIIVGPLLGGWLADHLSWRWLFFINVPIAATTLLLLRGITESRDEDPEPLDFWGAALVTLALGALAYGWTEWHPGQPPAMLIAMTFLGAMLGVAFVVREKKAANPMVPPSMFASRPFTMTNVLTLFLYAALGALTFFLPFNLIGARHYSATMAGAANLPLIVLMTLLSPISGRWASRHGWRLPLIAGPALAGLGFVLLARPGAGASYWRGFFPALIILGLGMAITVAPLTTAVMSSASRERAGIASGINNAVSRAAGLLAIALVGAQVAATFSATLDRELARRHVPAPIVTALAAQKSKLTDAALPRGTSPDVARSAEASVDAAFLRAFRLAMFLCAAMALAAAVCGVFTQPEPRDSHEGDGGVTYG